ncbi:MAG: ATP-binding protein [Myxococcota bacterium]|nr:ATP-binding protein [Myxococcota bacterium]
MSRSRILLVDDNAEFAENLGEILEGAGYQVTTAGTCAAARKVAEGPLELALVDLKLPDGDGTDLARAIKEGHPDSEVILLTGFATLESAAAAVRAGACAYLLKPTATPELLLTVEQAMRQVRLHQEKRELSRRAQVAEKLAAVGTLTAGLSHEIRNPLNAAGLQLTVLERRIRKLPADQQKPLLGPLTLVRDEIGRLDHILQDFLQFARPTHFVPRPVDLVELLRRVGSLFSADAEQRGLKLEVATTPVGLINGDEGRLQQVVVNLALNSMEASPPGGVVLLSCFERQGEVWITIEDSGTGIPEEVLGRLFEPFFTTKASGSGLGLSIVHAVVAQHGGTITAENRAQRGARFTVRLPKAP